MKAAINQIYNKRTQNDLNGWETRKIIFTTPVHDCEKYFYNRTINFLTWSGFHEKAKFQQLSSHLMHYEKISNWCSFLLNACSYSLEQSRAKTIKIFPHFVVIRPKWRSWKFSRRYGAIIRKIFFLITIIMTYHDNYGI